MGKRKAYKDLPESTKESMRRANRKWRKAHPEREATRRLAHNAYMNKRWKANVTWLRQIKVERGCATCPEKDYRCLDFHHKDPTTKSFTIGRSGSQGRKTLQKEIDKCIILCANCHRKLEID